MVSECDSVIRQSIPAVRIAVARLLRAKYKIGQGEIAKRMGITQAAVNKYLNGKYSGKIKKIVTGMKAAGFDKKIAGMIVSGKGVSLVNKNVDRAASSMYIRANR